MSYEAHLDEDKSIQVASNTGWYNACDWMEGLDEEEYPEIANLNDEGICEVASEVADEFEKAMKDDPPDDDVAKTIKGLVKFIRGGDVDAVLVISNGMGGDNDDDSEDEK